VLSISSCSSPTFLAAPVAGLAGFAFGLVAAAAWLHVLTPAQTVSLIVAFGLIVQGGAVWKLRHALQWARLWFLIGGAPGVLIWVMALSWVDPGDRRGRRRGGGCSQWHPGRRHGARRDHRDDLVRRSRLAQGCRHPRRNRS
jgi:hypothetical protein